jgi:hypothetical protein
LAITLHSSFSKHQSYCFFIASVNFLGKVFNTLQNHFWNGHLIFSYNILFSENMYMSMKSKCLWDQTNDAKSEARYIYSTFWILYYGTQCICTNTHLLCFSWMHVLFLVFITCQFICLFLLTYICMFYNGK